MRYTAHGDLSDSSKPAVVMVHGFGASCEHWRKSVKPLCDAGFRVYAIDLLGYGWSDKPESVEPAVLYTMETWAHQLNDFVSEVVQTPAFFACNSIGCIVALQAAVNQPHTVQGLFLLDISLRGLHVKNQSQLSRPFISAFQWMLWNSPIGELFFKSVANPNAIRNVLKEAYCDHSAVTDELVQALLQPGLLPNANRVFLDFLTYSGGPLPSELLNAIEPLNVPIAMAWGQEDPWEDIRKGRDFEKYNAVHEFIELPAAGHCPQDEQPDKVNSLIIDFVHRHCGNELLVKI